ncbi:hypothetical protein AYO44_14970 [Planctomycetaceae bacterium SCGC AG-212-F19]|nr:hypothetical protein AYO44_14970 [Planctomycetaceae bacterium SCGC AG-212-F19]
MARDAIARLYDVEKDLVRLDAEAGTIVFQTKKGKSLAVEKLYESYMATSLFGPNGIETIRYLEITALGETVVGPGGMLLKVAGTTQRFALGNDPESKPLPGEKPACQRLREALTKGAKVTGVTGRIHGWTAPLSAKDPDQLAGKKPLLLIVTDFQTSPK